MDFVEFKGKKYYFKEKEKVGKIKNQISNIFNNR